MQRKGTIVIDVKADLSPIAVGNFVALAACGYYDGVVFHRLVPGFVIQGGDRTGTGSGGPGYTIADEPVTTAYQRGTVAMARSSPPNSLGSQFSHRPGRCGGPTLATEHEHLCRSSARSPPGMDVGRYDRGDAQQRRAPATRPPAGRHDSVTVTNP